MKKSRALIMFSTLLVALFAVFALSSCGGGNEPTKLTAPTVTLDGDTARWSAEGSCDKFEISIDGNLSYIENTVTEKKLTDTETFKIRAVGDGVNYLTSDWSNSVTYTKPEEEKTFTVTWKNGDTVLEIDEGVAFGATPTYNGATPVKDADAQYAYVFSGWSPELSAVSGNVTYVASFNPVPNSYTVIWKNGDKTLETDEGVPYGASPSYDGAVPVKETTVQYTYTFAGWAPEISKVTESVTYYAQFTEELRKYTVTFYHDDGATVLDTVTVNYGETAVYSKSTPVKNPTEKYTYVFDKWVSELSGDSESNLTNISGNMAVYASFKEFIRTVTVNIYSGNTSYGSVSVSEINNVPYGSSITVDGNKVVINGKEVVAIANEPNAQYTYSFVDWSADETVGNDTIITANFSRTVNTYTITWKNGDTVLEIDEGVPYGRTPVYDGEIPKKGVENESIYVFSGWNPSVSTVTGDAVYVAQFENTEGNHTVIFYDEDGVTELGRVVVGHTETAVYPNDLPVKESTKDTAYSFEKWVTEKNGNVEASLDNVVDNLVVYAKYTSSVRTYKVTFRDFDGRVVDEKEVAYGSSATAPEDPEREGFRFDGWDKDFSLILEDTSVTARYVQQCLVEFLDYDNTLIDSQLVDYNGNATAPENPERNNYRFIGWNTGFTNVVSDLQVRAEYVRQYRVEFVDYNGTLLKEELVDSGTGATAPSAPTLDGYSFVGWDKTFTEVIEDMTVTAVYKVKTYTVKFVMPDGTLIGEEQSVEHGFSAILPEYPEFFLFGEGDYTEVYGFTSWNKEFDSVTEDLTVEAIYDSDYTKPVIIIEFSKERNGDAKLYIFNHESMKLNAIEFTINYSTNTGNISIKSATVNSASPLWVENNDGSNNNQYVINNNENSFTFAWSDAAGKQFAWCSRVITFSFSTDGATVSKDNFVIDSCSAVVSGNDSEDFEKITPVVVYR